MFAGGVLSWLVLLPLLSILGNYMTVPFPPVPASGLRIDEMSAAAAVERVHPLHRRRRACSPPASSRSRRTIPTIVSSFRDSVKDFGAGQPAVGAHPHGARPPDVDRASADRCLLAIFLAVAPRHADAGQFPRRRCSSSSSASSSSPSRRASPGLIGSSSNPISGMTIATLILTCTIFVALGWTGDCYCAGRASASAPSSASRRRTPARTSQDLKTGYIVGATPFYQQIGLIIGVHRPRRWSSA